MSSADEKSHALDNLRGGLEKIASHTTSFLPTGKELHISKKNIGFVAAKVKRGDVTITSLLTTANMVSTSVNTNYSDIPTSKELASMKIPESTFTDKEVSLFSFSYRNNALFINKDKVTTGSCLLYTSPSPRDS